MGVTVKDYVPIYSEKIGVKFSPQLAGPDGECALWADVLQPSSASVLATYTGPYDGEPAITINSFGKGKAIYLGADLDPASLARVLGALLETAGIKSSFGLPRGVEVSVRKSGERQWIFVLNHTAASQEISLPGQFKDQLTGAIHSGSTTLDPYDVLVLQRT
jgi:beta-galactosidase